ncbi:MAG: Mth938-like domain-containing protein [Eubacteriales bacterium]
MFNDQRGPIEHYSWGKFIILGEEHSQSAESQKGKGKDIILIGKKVRAWKKRKGHELNQAMVEKILNADVEILVIGNGADGALSVSEEMVNYLMDHGIKKVIVMKTPEACREYNRLFHNGEKAALLAHGTC